MHRSKTSECSLQTYIAIIEMIKNKSNGSLLFLTFRERGKKEVRHYELHNSLLNIVELHSSLPSTQLGSCSIVSDQ